MFLQTPKLLAQKDGGCGATPRLQLEAGYLNIGIFCIKNLKMVVMEKCCCCSVRTACLIFGAFALLGSFLQLSKDGKEVAKNLSSDEHQRESVVDALYNDLRQIMDVDKDEIRNFFKINFYLAIPDFVLCFAMLIAAGCLIYGVRSKKGNFLIPVMVVFPLDLFVRVIFVFVLVINFGISHPISIGSCVIFFYGIFFDVFVWLCVFSHWQQLRDEGGPSNRDYNAVSKV